MELSESATPDARELASLRNRIEHRFLTIQHYNTGSSDSDTHAFVTTDEFIAKTMRIMRMARAALTYLSLAMYREESIRSENAKDRTVLPSVQSVPIIRPRDDDQLE